MSTILNTLKKLEEEKSVLDRSLNLKGLVLQTDRAVFPRQDKERGSHTRGLIALIVAGVVVGVSLGIYFNPTDKATTKNIPKPARATAMAAEVPPAAPVPAQTAPVQPAQVPVQPAQAQTVQKETAVGIPLSSIPSPAKAAPPAPAVDPAKVNPAPPAPQQPVQVAKASPAPSVSSPAPVAKVKTSPSAAKIRAPSNSDSPFVDQVDDNKPESEIIAMEILPESYDVDTGIAGAKVNKLQTAQPSIPKQKEPGGYSGIPIPNVKMKGIIYFSANNPLNYILVTGPKDANQKLKIGESFQDATLKDVQPDRAIFTYKDQLTQLRIGE